MAFKKGQGGRPKGATNKAKRNKDSRVLSAIAQVAVCSVPATGVLMLPTAPTVAPEGISAKDLMLTTMRMAWESAHRKAAEAREMDELANVATDSDSIENYRKLANELRIEAGRHVALAQSAAKDVAPYMHAKLATQDMRVAGNIVVQIKNYAPV